MEPAWLTFQLSLERSTALFLSGIIAFLPRILAGLLVLTVGIWIARIARSVIIHSLEKMKLHKGLENTPVQAFLHNAEITNTLESIIGGVVYWLLVLFVVYTCVGILGLEAASEVLNRILLFLPQVFSALLIVIFGTLLAGLAEAVVKGAVKSIDPQTGRLMGKFTSYSIIVVAIMAAISELGIAQQFITTLFTGVIVALSLAFGLAFGLGSKDVVAKMMDDWYKRMRKDEQS